MMNARMRWCLAAAACLVAGGPVRAAEDEETLLSLAYGDATTISLATRGRQALRHAPAVATVITADDIAAMGATDLDQVLETVAGLHVNIAPSMRNRLYVVRGVFSLQTPQVLVLQNGLPITVMLTGGRGNLSAGPAVENIARIEVIRGPGSALYGADAFSGVINLITHAAGDAARTTVGARTGSFGSRDAWLRHGGSSGELAWAAFASSSAATAFAAPSTRTRRRATTAPSAPGPAWPPARPTPAAIRRTPGWSSPPAPGAGARCTRAATISAPTPGWARRWTRWGAARATASSPTWPGRPPHAATGRPARRCLGWPITNVTR
jgi:outer membrane receptor protein involved in Fe transport